MTRPDPSSRFVYVANRTAGSVSIFKIGTTTPGKLVSAGATNAGATPTDVVIAP